jgi:hypothetical protein
MSPECMLPVVTPRGSEKSHREECETARNLAGEWAAVKKSTSRNTFGGKKVQEVGSKKVEEAWRALLAGERERGKAVAGKNARSSDPFECEEACREAQKGLGRQFTPCQGDGRAWRTKAVPSRLASNSCWEENRGKEFVEDSFDAERSILDANGVKDFIAAFFFDITQWSPANPIRVSGLLSSSLHICLAAHAEGFAAVAPHDLRIRCKRKTDRSP